MAVLNYVVCDHSLRSLFFWQYMAVYQLLSSVVCSEVATKTQVVGCACLPASSSCLQNERGITQDTEMTAQDLQNLVERYKKVGRMFSLL